MAIGWLTVLKMVPWGDVIENAPKVASGAKKLWDRVGKKTPPMAAPMPMPMPDPAVSMDTPTIAELQAQIAALQASTAELHQQMLQSSELIESLAVQNTQLIGRVEVNRRRLLWLAVLVFGLLLGLIRLLLR